MRASRRYGFPSFRSTVGAFKAPSSSVATGVSTGAARVPVMEVLGAAVAVSLLRKPRVWRERRSSGRASGRCRWCR